MWLFISSFIWSEAAQQDPLWGKAPQMHNVRVFQYYYWWSESSHDDDAYRRKAIQVYPLQLHLCDSFSSAEPHEDAHRGVVFQVKLMQQSFRMEEYAHKTFQTLHDLKLNSDFEIQLISSDWYISSAINATKYPNKSKPSINQSYICQSNP